MPRLRRSHGRPGQAISSSGCCTPNLGVEQRCLRLGPDYFALNEVRRKHARGNNDVFVQVLEMAQRLGLARMGTVAIDSTRVKANASAHRVERVEQARQQRARKRRRVRRWQKACDADEGNEGAGTSVGTACEELR